MEHNPNYANEYLVKRYNEFAALSIDERLTPDSDVVLTAKASSATIQTDYKNAEDSMRSKYVVTRLIETVIELEYIKHITPINLNFPEQFYPRFLNKYNEYMKMLRYKVLWITKAKFSYDNPYRLFIA